MNKKILLLLFLCIPSFQIDACETKACDSHQVDRFSNRSTIYSLDRSREDILQDIFFALKCEQIDIGERLSDILIKKGGFYGYYYRYRFSQLKNKEVNSSALSDLTKSAELGYTRAMYELSKFYQKNKNEKLANYWLIKAASEYNEKALFEILTAKGSYSFITKDDYDFYVMSYWFLTLPEEYESNELVKNEINKVLKNLSKERYQTIISKILEKFRYQISLNEIEFDVPFRPFDY